LNLPKQHKTAAQNGSTYAPTKLRSITDADTGERKHIAVAKRFKSWTFNADNGKLCVNVRYGARILELAKGKRANEGATAKERVTTFYPFTDAPLARDNIFSLDLLLYLYYVCVS
jgi:hypothetical protein